MAQRNRNKAALALALSLAAATALAQSCAGSKNPDATSNASSSQPGGSATVGGSRTNDAAMGNAPSGALATADRTFMEEAARGGIMEVQLGNYAASHASNEQVRQFGERMVQDHSKANEELKALAKSKGIDLPTSLDAKHQAEIDKFQKSDGATFDSAYMQHMVEDHAKDVKMFDAQAKNGKDPEVKAFAAKTLPTLQEHLTLARSTYDAVKSTGTTGTGASR